MSHKNGEMMTQKQLKELAELSIQNDERIEQLWDAVIELKLAAISARWPLKDAQAVQDSARIRAQHAGSVEMQRKRFRKYLGLD